MLGVVLAAGTGTRLGSLTASTPKALLAVDGDRTILDVALRNLGAAGVAEAIVVTGFAADRIEALLPELEQRHGLALRTTYNPRAVEWNNAYSLWCARDAFGDGVLLVNGDTVHPPEVEQRLLAAPAADVVLALDDGRALDEEAMKVLLSPTGVLGSITKAMDPRRAAGEYIGVARIEAAAAERLAAALEATWRRDPSLYYEDGFQELADRGGRIAVASVGGLDWVEVDDAVDLARAREIACRC